jgi:quinol monooxygenase YgiN
MSVIMTMWVKGDPNRLEEYAASNEEQVRSIRDLAKNHGLIAHRFYGSEGQIMVIDEWPDEQSFQSFFEEAGDQIRGMMEAVGASGQPGINFWRKLDSRDEVGWES